MFPNREIAARRFWEGIARLGGTLERAAGTRAYDGVLRDEAVYHRGSDGTLYPIQCAADVRIAGEVWRVELKEREWSRGTVLAVKLAFPAAHLETAESLLDITVPPRVVLRAVVPSMDEVAELYERIRAKTDDVRDPALLRPGRFDYVVEVPCPDRAGRRAIFSVHLRGKPIADLDLDAIADASEGLAGAQIEHIVARATFAAARREAKLRGVDLSNLTSLDNVRIEQADLMAALAELRAEPR